METESRSWISWGGVRGAERDHTGVRGDFKLVKMVIILTMGMVLWVYYACGKMHKIVHFKYVLFILCQIYLNKAIKIVYK